MNAWALVFVGVAAAFVAAALRWQSRAALVVAALLAVVVADVLADDAIPDGLAIAAFYGAIPVAVYAGWPYLARVARRTPGLRWFAHPPFAVSPDGSRVDVYANRTKLFLLTIGMVAFTVIGAVIAIVEPHRWLGWATLAFFGAGGVFWIQRTARRGLFGHRPALVLDRDGLVDNQNGLQLRWDEIERLQPFEISTGRGGTQYFLGIHPKDPDAVLDRLGGVHEFLAQFSDLVGVEAPVAIPVNVLAVSTDELVPLVGRFWDGPIDGYALEETAAPKLPRRRSRLRRFVGWAVPNVVGLGLAFAIVVLVIRFSD